MFSPFELTYLRCFLRDDHEKRKLKVTERRKLFIEDVCVGFTAKELCEKYNIKHKKPSQYVNKIIKRYCIYAGLAPTLGVRKIRQITGIK